MRCQFLHLADVHLGYQQYGLKERFNDFGRAFEAAVDYALEKAVDFVLITGDLFHKSAVDPPTLLQAVNNLDRLRQAGIPVLAVEGNHDRARYRYGYSWLDFLAEQGYLALLSPLFEEKGMALPPWDGSEGAYMDIGKVRIYGLPYLGASIRPVLAELPGALAASRDDHVEFTVLMAHFGLEGEIPGAVGGLAQSEIAPLREHVDYLALGHWHKPFQRQGWVYNPGSLETCSVDECHWQGGFYHVTVDTGRNPNHTALHVKSLRRPFYRWRFAVDEYPTPQALHRGLKDWLEARSRDMPQPERAPIVELGLEGILAFDRNDLDLDHIRGLVREVLSPLHVRIRNDTRPVEFEITPGQRLGRAELERCVLRELVMRDARYRGQADAWASLMSELKRMVLAGSEPESIVETLRQRLREMGHAD